MAFRPWRTGRRNESNDCTLFLFFRRGHSTLFCCGFFIFIFFISVFYKNIFSIWKFTEIYPGRHAAGRPGPGRPAAGRQGLFRKKKIKKIADSSLGPVARLRGGRPWPACRMMEPGGGRLDDVPGSWERKHHRQFIRSIWQTSLLLITGHDDGSQLAMNNPCIQTTCRTDRQVRQTPMNRPATYGRCSYG